MKLILLGGASIEYGDQPEIQALLQENIKDKKVLSIDIAGRDENHIQKKREEFSKYFEIHQSKDYQFFSVIKDNNINDVFVNSEVVYLTGGNPEIQLNNMKKYNIIEKLKNFSGTIIGNSAGTVNLSKEALWTADKDMKETTFVEGIGLVDFSTEVHFEEKNKDLLISLSENKKIYALAENAAMIIENSCTKFVGDIWLFENGNSSKVSNQ